MPIQSNQAQRLKFMRMAADLARQNVVAGGGGPFGAVVVKDGEVIAIGTNTVTVTNDPTAHAEVVAIRRACEALGSFQLAGCEIYSSCEPCPMCLGAIYWARPDVLYYAGTQADAAEAGFDDRFIYQELALPIEGRKLKMVHLAVEDALTCFDQWKAMNSKTEY